MDSFKAYKYFMAVKLHFTSEKYDLFEKNGRVSGTRETFNKRNDRGLFEKLSKKFDTDQDLIQFFVSNFAYGNKNVIYSKESDDYYEIWKARKESRTEFFRNDLSNIYNHLERNRLKGESLYSIEDGIPVLLNLYLGGFIRLETMVILQDFEDYLQKWDPLIMLWHDHFLTIRKAKKFVKYDLDKVQSIYQQYKDSFAEL